MKNTFHIQHIRDGQVIEEFDVDNLVTNDGKNDMLDTMFGAQAKRSWYIGLISSTGFTGVAASDTLAAHAGWVEATTYAGARKPFTVAAASGQAVTNAASKAEFVVNAPTTIQGIFLASADAGSVGKLFSEATLPASKSLTSGDSYFVSYQITQ